MTIIETSRLRLRPLIDDDAEFITREIGNYNVSKNLARVPHPYHLSDALDFLDWIKSFDDRSLVCGVALKSDTQNLIGVISYDFDEATGVAEFGYWYAEKFWGNGYGKEAALAVLRHAFEIKKIERLTSAFHNNNPASAKILLGLGFVEVRQEMHYSKAQDVEVLSTKLSLTRGRFLNHKKSIS